MRKSTLLGFFVIISYIILFYGVFGDFATARTGVVLLIVLDVLAYLLTLPPEYMHWRTARKVIACLLAGSKDCVTDYPRASHKTINILLAAFVYTLVMIAAVVLLDAIMYLQNLSLSILICLLSGMLIVRMQLAYEIEAESGAYHSRLG